MFQTLKRFASRTFSKSGDTLATLPTLSSIFDATDDQNKAQVVKRKLSLSDDEDYLLSKKPRVVYGHALRQDVDPTSIPLPTGDDASLGCSPTPETHVDDIDASRACDNTLASDAAPAHAPTAFPSNIDASLNAPAKEVISPVRGNLQGDHEDEQDYFHFPELDETKENVFLTWADGIVDLLKNGGADEAPVLWLKSQILGAYGGISDIAKEELEEADPTVGYWGISVDSEDLVVSAAKALDTQWDEQRAPHIAKEDGWWWQVTVVRHEPAEAQLPRLRVRLESSRHDSETAVWGGKDLGHWWVIGFELATENALSAMKLHRSLF